MKQELKGSEVQRYYLEKWRPFLKDDKAREDNLVSMLSPQDLQTVEKLSGASVSPIKNDLVGESNAHLLKPINSSSFSFER